jgi:ferrochelatase
MVGTRTGVLLVNLGSPAAPDRAAVGAFLDEFLRDPDVVPTNRLVWWLVRKLVVLRKRAPASAALYRKIWTDEGSPLLVFARRLQEAVARELGDEFAVEVGMRYGRPSLADGLARLAAAGCRPLLLLPMFPQASRATTGSIEKEARRLCARRNHDVRILPPYFDRTAYHDAMAASVRTALAHGPVDHVVFSFHGLPVRAIADGDPYQRHCEATAAALADALAFAPDRWTLAYQSRFGGEPWLTPDTRDVVLARAADRGRVLLACPGFAADCLETLEEIDLRLRADFHTAGGAELRTVPCLNDDPLWVRAVAEMVREASPAM